MATWQKEVWDVVSILYEDFKSKKPTAYTAENIEYWQKQLQQNGRTLAVPFNMAWLNPVATAIPKDEISLPRAADAGRYYFYKNERAQAPREWPLGKNITIAVMKRALPTKRTVGLEDFTQVANSHILQGFWWAFAQALRAVARKDCKENHDAVLSFKYLMLRGVVDIVHATTLTNVTELAFQFVEDNEELRKNMGFTGFRKMLLVSWAVSCVKDTKTDKKEPNAAETSKWLLDHFRFSDEAQKPSEDTVRVLMRLCAWYLPNKKSMAAYTRCELLWGRNTTFDDYTKLNLLANRAAGPNDLAFLTEWIALYHFHQAHTEKCETLSKAEISTKAGEISTALVCKGAVEFLKKQGPESWKKHEIIQSISTPLGCYDRMLSPSGGPAPGPETATWLDAQQKLSAAPPSLRICATLMKQVYTRGSNFRQGVKGKLGNNATIEDYATFFETTCKEAWTELKGALQAERPAAPPGTDGDGQASSSGGGQDASKAAGDVDSQASADVAAEITRAAVEAKARPPTGGS